MQENIFAGSMTSRLVALKSVPDVTVGSDSVSTNATTQAPLGCFYVSNKNISRIVQEQNHTD
jgi:hypothetical protein